MEFIKLRLPPRFLLKHALFRVRKAFKGGDDYDWSNYPDHYRAEVKAGRKWYNEDLHSIVWKLEDGRIFIAADETPLHPTHRNVWEAVVNLAPSSVSEVGMGGGRFLAGLRELLGPGVELRGYDVEAKQLELFHELYPAAAATISSSVLDITLSPLPKVTEVVFASTVLMHIRRPDAYRQALRNLLSSASRAVVLMDNYATHDYLPDLISEAGPGALYVYDTGRAVSIVVSIGRALDLPYKPLTSASQLR
jgi:SAM-dependent methyltransferase